MQTALSYRGIFRRSFLSLPITAAFTGAASAHEAWLLTPSELEALSQLPLPGLFTSSISLGIASLVGVAVTVGALRAEKRLHPIEARLMAPMVQAVPAFGPLAIRLGLSSMLALSALGGLARHGTAPWTEPTLFVPDMQLVLAPGWDWLAGAQLALAAVIATGFLVRLAALGVIALSMLGLAAFGNPFVGYAPHFIAPALMLAICGAGTISLDRILDLDDWLRPDTKLGRAGWSGALALLGAGFVYLSVSYKLTQPTLVMAILDHGEVPLFGLPLAVVALVMTGVELIAGALLALGRLTRPIALFLIGSFTFFAVTLGESPLFHANLYGVMFMLMMAGREPPPLAVERRLKHSVAT